jgi:hypothetical protein
MEFLIYILSSTVDNYLIGNKKTKNNSSQHELCKKPNKKMIFF